MWKNLVQGALWGLAGSAGSTHFGGGLARGAAGYMQGKQQEVDNETRAAQQASDIKFRELQSADMASRLTMQSQELQNSTQEHNDKHDQAVKGQVDWNENRGVVYDEVPNTPGNVLKYMRGANAASGGKGVDVPAGILMDSGTIYIPKPGVNSNDTEFDRISLLAPAIGVQTPVRQDYDNMSKQDKKTLSNEVNAQAVAHDPKTGRFYTTAAQQGQANDNLESSIDAFKDSDAYKADPAKGQATVDMLTKNLTAARAYQAKLADTETKNAAAIEAAKKGLTPAQLQQQGQADLTEAQNKARKAQADAAAPGSNLTGEPFLATLPAARQAQVRAIGEGRQELTPSMLRTKDGQALSEQVNQAYPDFQQGNSSAYVGLRKDFTYGKSAATANSLNTVETHLGRMYQHLSQPHTSGGWTGAVTGLLGDKDVQALKIDSQAVSTELSKAYAQGQISEGEVKDWESKLDPTAFGMTTAKLQTNIREIDALLEGKQKALQSQWENGVPKNVKAPIQIINPDAQAARNVIRGETNSQSVTPQAGQAHPVIVNGKQIGVTRDGGKTMTAN